MNTATGNQWGPNAISDLLQYQFQSDLRPSHFSLKYKMWFQFQFDGNAINLYKHNQSENEFESVYICTVAIAINFNMFPERKITIDAQYLCYVGSD